MSELSADNLFKELSEEIKKKEDLDYSIRVLKEKHKPLMQLFTASAKGDDSVPVFESPEELRNYVIQNPLLKLESIEIYSYHDEFAGEVGVIEKEVSGEEKEFFYLDFDNYIYSYSETESVKSSNYEWRSQHSVAKSLRLKNMYDEFEKRGMTIKNEVFETRNEENDNLVSFMVSELKDEKEELCRQLNIEISEYDYQKVRELLQQMLDSEHGKDQRDLKIHRISTICAATLPVLALILYKTNTISERVAYGVLGIYGLLVIGSQLGLSYKHYKDEEAIDGKISFNNGIDEYELHIANIQTLLEEKRYGDVDFYLKNMSAIFGNETPITPDNKELKGKQFVLGIRTK